MNPLVKHKILVLILLYNCYFLASLVKGYSINHDLHDSHQPIPVYTLAQDLPTDFSPLINEDTTTVFKTKQHQVKKEVIESPAQYFMLKTYIQHNHLHFNIPVICYKFPVSQHTSDG